MNNLFSAIKKIFSAVIPNRCKVCGNVIELDESLCDECKKLKMIRSPRCKYCGYEKSDCRCNKHKNEYKQIAAPFYYESNVIIGVHNFKENGMPFLAKGYAEYMLSAIKECYAGTDFDLITFVPLRRVKKHIRGFNQSELIAGHLSANMNVPCADMLDKVRYTGVQHKKSAKQRKIAAFGAYDVKKKYKDKLDGKVILLIDDVKTTGSTLNECAKMLKIYGAKAVYASAFAIAKLEDKQ